MPDDSSSLDLDATLTGVREGQQLLGRFRVQRILGRGGMGVVWLARDEKLDRDVALKFLPEALMHDLGAMNDLRDETRRSLEITHPNIVRVFDLVEDKRCAAIAMEFIDGDTLSNLKAAQPARCFEVTAIERWVTQLCDALAYAHGTVGVVHRDLKPANLMIDPRGALKVTDFGIARSIMDSVSRLSLGANRSGAGTLAYMSPQQALGERPTVLDDVYAVGATIYDLLTGKPPFFSGELYAQVREKVPPSMTERRAELNVAASGKISECWEQLVAACLAKDPAARPQNVWEISRRLGFAAPAGEEPKAAPRAAEAVVRIPRPPRRRRAVALGLTGAALAGLAALTPRFLEMQQDERDDAQRSSWAAEKNSRADQLQNVQRLAKEKDELAAKAEAARLKAIEDANALKLAKEKSDAELARIRVEKEAAEKRLADESAAANPAKSVEERQAALKRIFDQLEARRTALQSDDQPARDAYNRDKDRYEQLLKNLRDEVASKPTPPTLPVAAAPAPSTPPPTSLGAAAIAGIKSSTPAPAKKTQSRTADSPGTRARMPKDETHSCLGMNSCRGRGGCKTGDMGCAGKNTCKGKGGCPVKNGIPIGRH